MVDICAELCDYGLCNMNSSNHSNGPSTGTTLNYADSLALHATRFETTLELERLENVLRYRAM